MELSKVSKKCKSDDPTENRSADNYLVKQCLQGDTHSFRQLYRCYQQRVRSILYQLCAPDCLDDLVQEVFLRAWKGLPKFRQEAKFSTWLYRIATNVAYDRRHAATQTKTKLQNLSQQTPTHQQAPDLMELHYQDLVQRGLANLSFAYRTILVLHDLEQVPQREVAQILEIPLGTVKSRLFNARAAMRKYFQQQGVQL
ncbi:RNA polymerase subunit sigma [Mastigocoleus testarum BC008]|uniref:RNA polymerase subunit sigma n=1 Tax=Mastigocoleus testarum BC008 TaxID=371196 RepID=A0A0V7ZSK2_9CYAN|nr:RNA polymerase subunit sigma [Mastigocoleus testarum BC008]